MAFTNSVTDNVVKIAGLFGDTLGSAAGQLSSPLLREKAQEKIRSVFTDTTARIDATLAIIDAKSAELLATVSAELKQASGKTAHTIGSFTKRADEKFSATVQNGTLRLIDLAGAVRSTLSK